MDYYKWFVRHQRLPLQHFVKNLEGELEFEFYSDIFTHLTFVTLQRKRSYFSSVNLKTT